jgi:molybdopterin-guanine dinucleotide biosynthesis protein A
MTVIAHQDISALILAGGRGARMGGTDKGLQKINGTPLALNALLRLQMQQGGAPAECLINANRNLGAYEAFGVPVWPDSLPDFAGPLAGFLCGLERAETPYLLTVPCDTPLFPLDLLERMAQAFDPDTTDIAVASAMEEDGQLRPQPVFCLMNVMLLESLVAFTQSGGRKIDQWTTQHRVAIVPFDRDQDDRRAFFNANTLDELQLLQTP